jgi:hypothetical protein
VQPAPNLSGSEQGKRWYYDWIAGVWATAAIKSDTRHELAVPRREPLPPGTQLLVITGDINCGAAAVRKPEHGDPVGPDIWSSGEEIGCGERVLRALARSYLAPIGADIVVAARRKAIEPQGRVPLGPHQRRADGQRRRAVNASAVVQKDHDGKRALCDGFLESARKLDLLAVIVHRHRNFIAAGCRTPPAACQQNSGRTPSHEHSSLVLILSIRT